jgi:hypothetical protein
LRGMIPWTRSRRVSAKTAWRTGFLNNFSMSNLSASLEDERRQSVASSRTSRSNSGSLQISQTAQNAAGVGFAVPLLISSQLFTFSDTLEAA